MKPIDRPHQYLNLKTSAEVGNDVDYGAKIRIVLILEYCELTGCVEKLNYSL